jgi:hypothetical protein
VLGRHPKPFTFPAIRVGAMAFEGLALFGGRRLIAWSSRVGTLDKDTGRVLALNTLPTGPSPVDNASLKHVTIAPDTSKPPSLSSSTKSPTTFGTAR